MEKRTTQPNNNSLNIQETQFKIYTKKKLSIWSGQDRYRSQILFYRPSRIDIDQVDIDRHK